MSVLLSRVSDRNNTIIGIKTYNALVTKSPPVTNWCRPTGVKVTAARKIRPNRLSFKNFIAAKYEIPIQKKFWYEEFPNKANGKDNSIDPGNGVIGLSKFVVLSYGYPVSQSFSAAMFSASSRSLPPSIFVYMTTNNVIKKMIRIPEDTSDTRSDTVLINISIP